MTAYTHRRRRVWLMLYLVVVAIGLFAFQQWSVKHQPVPQTNPAVVVSKDQSSALYALGRLAVKAAASHDGYSRDQFGSGWASIDGCDTRNRILQRDLEKDVLDTDGCTVLSGVLEHDPYSSQPIAFTRGPGSSSAVQIDHVVALSNAWETGAQGLSAEQRRAFANDGLNLLAVDGPTNMSKGDSDASEWLPPNESYRCSYIARQVAVKLKYALWITATERDVMAQTLGLCPTQTLPT